jgi:Mn2+/Fe2+ NRAMP family transporter
MQAGALFGYTLLWVIVLGTAAIILYMEMCGRVAVVAGEPVFATIRTRLGDGLGLITLIASNLLNLITCAAEMAGIGIILHLLLGWNERLSMVGAALMLGALVLLLKFEWIERVFGLSGLLMLVFGVAAWGQKPDWPDVAMGLLPRIPVSGTHDLLLYGYFAVGIFSALLMAYEVHFYSSGAIEEDWSTDDLAENAVVASLGSVLGSVLTAALLVLGGLVFFPRGIFPDALSSAALPAALPFGPVALRFALLGILACLAGAAIETMLSGAYNVCQFYNFEWGKNRKIREVPIFTAQWLGMLCVALVLAISGIKPLTLVNYAIVFGMLILPLTYYPILKLAGNTRLLGKHANGRFYNAVGWAFLALITLAALAAIPLMVLTKNGQP